MQGCWKSWSFKLWLGVDRQTPLDLNLDVPRGFNKCQKCNLLATSCQAEAYTKEEAELSANIGALGGAIAAISKGKSGPLLEIKEAFLEIGYNREHMNF